MKKSFSLALLAPILLSSTSVLAEDAATEQSGTTEVTVTVPEKEVTPEETASYMIHIPATTSLVYGDSSRQYIGSVSVSNVTGIGLGKQIQLTMSGTNLVSGTNTIPVRYDYDSYLVSISTPVNSNLSLNTAETSYNGSYGTYHTDVIYATVSKDVWDAAASGTYSATLTFNFAVTDWSY